MILILPLAASPLLAAGIPYPAALDGAAIVQERLDDVLDNSLILGNGDINALVWTEQGALMLMLTKNDVWDARLDAAKDPPLPTLARIKELGRAGGKISDPILPEGVTWSGPDSYHSHAYPCPRACAKLRIGRGTGKPGWQRIRAEGQHNALEQRGNVTVMSIRGRKEASNGYAFGPMAVSTDDYSRLRVRLSGTANARFYVDVMGPDNRGIFGSGWKESPTQAEERTFNLPSGQKAARIILYTWTEDGALAENRFESVAFEGRAGSLPVDLRIVAPPTSAARLDVRRAVAEVAGAPDGPPRAEVRALANRNAFLIRTDAAAELLSLASADLPAVTQGDKDRVRWRRQDIPGDLDWPGMSFAVALASRGEQTAVAIVTSRESRNVVSDAVALARSTARAQMVSLVNRHEQEWERFWSRSGIEIGDSLLQQTWYRSLYFLRCVSRPGAICPGLFASLVNDHPAWHGDYHTNYNIQQTFWAAYAANHAELAEPYDRLIREYLPRAQWLAGKVFSMRGAYYPHVLFAYEPPNPAKCRSINGRQYIHHTWGLTLGVTGFTVQPVWWHYKYEPSRRFLEQVAYPLMRETARFYAEFIGHCEGGDKVVLSPSVSPEHHGWTPRLARNRNCAFDIAMARFTLAAAIEGAETLKRDAGLVAQWKQAMKRLPDYPLHRDGEPVVVDVEGAPPINYNISVPATPVFPCDVVTWQSPAAERELFARTIEKMKWNGNNAAVMLAVARARLSMPASLEWLRAEVEARTRPNGTLTLNRWKPHHTFNDFGHYTEQFGAGMAVSELVLQSVGDIIRVFPAWPNEKDAKFTNLRAQGGFFVSAEQRNGKVVRLEIVSTVGGKLRLLNPWTGRLVECQTKAGEHLKFKP
jgi:hypothetical protein